MSAIKPCSETPDLLANLSYDDEQRYIKTLPFEFLSLANPKSPVTLTRLIHHLENGLICDGLTLTCGPSTVIASIANGNRASRDFARIFAEVNELPAIDSRRKFGSTLEDFLSRGIEEGFIVGWISEIAECTEDLEKVYRSDATIRDPARARFLVAALRRQQTS
jgi:hypothetical protein